MTKRVNGTPDRFVNEIDTWSSGGSGGAGGLVDQGNAGIQEWVIVDAAANTKLANILTELGNILAELQGTLSVSVGNFPASVEVSNDVGSPLPISGTVSVTEPVSVDDNGGSLTVDGTVGVSNFPALQPVSDNGGSLTVDGTVAVSNMVAATETGLAKDANLDALRVKIPDEEGTWSYFAGSSGTVNVPANGRVIGIAASTAQSGAAVAIDGGSAIPIPVPGSGVGAVDIAPRGNLIAPSIVFTNTDSYLVEVVT